MASKRAATSAIGWSVLHSWGSSLFGFIISVVLARLLAPEDFGLVAMALVYVRFASYFVDQGLGSAIIQRETVDAEHYDSAFWISVTASAALAGLSLVLAGPVAHGFGHRELGPIVRWLSLSLILGGLQSTQKAILQRHLDFRPLAVRAVAANLIGGIAGIAAAAGGLGVWSLVVQLLTSESISTVLLWRIADWRPSATFSRPHASQLYGFSLSVLVTNLLSFANRHSDDLMIGFFLGPIALGYYTIAYDMLRKMITLLVSVINRVAFPLFSRAQDDPVRVRNGLYAATQMTSLVAFPAFVGIIAIAPDFIQVVYGSKWSTSIPVLQVLSLVGIYNAVISFTNSLILASGKALWRMWLSFLTTVVTVAAFAVAVRWGIVAVAAAYVVSRFLSAPLYLWVLRKVVTFDLGIYLRQFALPAMGSLVMFVSVVAVRRALSTSVPAGVALGVYIATGMAVYAGFIRLTQPALIREVWRVARGLRMSRR